MDTTRTSELVSLGRKLVGISVLATALAYGPLAIAAPGDVADRAGTAGCETGAASTTLSLEPAVEWSSSPSMPGEPY